MNVRRILEGKHNKQQCDKVVNYVGMDPAKFKELLDVLFSGQAVLQQRAAWPLSYCIECNPSLAGPHIKKLLAVAASEGLHDAVRRNVLRSLQFALIPRSSQGEVIDYCFTILLRRSEPIACRVYAMTVLERLTRHLPDVRREIQMVLEDELPFANSGFRSRAVKLLPRLRTAG